MTPRDRWSTVLGIDLRSLAAFRIALGLLLLCDLGLRATELAAHYTDDGVLPRLDRIGIFDLASLDQRQAWSLHMWNGQAWAQVLLFLVAGLFASWLVIGYRTRLAAAASWILLVSLHARNPILQSFGDRILVCLLFFSMFTPLGAFASVDAALRPPGPRPTRVLSISTAALLLQPFFLYVVSTAFKTGPIWTRDLSAVHYTLHLDIFTTPLGQRLLGFPWALELLTIAVLALECVAPFAALSPWWSDRLRYLVIASFGLFHLGLALTLELGIFPFMAMAAWIPYLPSSFWDRVEPKVRWMAPPPIGRRLFSAPEQVRLMPGRWTAAIAASFLISQAIFNVRSSANHRSGAPTAEGWLMAAKITGLYQEWNMFSRPRTDDGWFAMVGILRDGARVNLWDPSRPLPWQKPPLVSATYHSERWRNYLTRLSKDDGRHLRPAFCRWLRRRWDRSQGDDEQRKLSRAEIHYMLERSPPPGEPLAPLEDIVLDTHDYPPSAPP